MAFTVAAFLVVYVLATTGLPVWKHYQVHAVVSPIQVSLAFFCGLNALIALWEIALGAYIRLIQSDYKKLKRSYGKKPLAGVMKFFNYPLSFSEAFSLRFWTKVWSTYALYDPSYQNNESFGFFIDVGNGWTTLVPTLVWLYAMTYNDLVPARALGCLGIAKFWQELYGTVIYALSFFFNNRQKNKSTTEVFLFVGVSNGLWFIFPIVGLYAAIQMVYTDSYTVFL